MTKNAPQTNNTHTQQQRDMDRLRDWRKEEDERKTPSSVKHRTRTIIRRELPLLIQKLPIQT